MYVFLAVSLLDLNLNAKIDNSTGNDINKKTRMLIILVEGYRFFGCIPISTNIVSSVKLDRKR